MQIKFIGTGGAFEPAYYNSAALLSLGGKTILIDAGFTVYSRLLELNLLLRPDYILLTHLHNDHCGSLANILLHRHFYGDGRQPIILCPSPAYRRQIEDLLTIQLKEPAKYAGFAAAQDLPGLSVLDTYGRHSENFQSYSFIFTEGPERIVYSGDLGQPDFLFAHLLTLPELPTAVFHDITYDPENTGHAHYSLLRPYLENYRIFGYHCDPTLNPADNAVPLVYYQPDLMY